MPEQPKTNMIQRIDLNLIPDHILRDVKSSLTKTDDPHDVSPDQVSSLSREEFVDAYLNWHGIFNYTHGVLEAVDAYSAASNSPKKSCGTWNTYNPECEACQDANATS